ncbi:MAG: hypothetical protein KatS3mg108_1710 [Isosphaeraceae bacterium]|jgi:hypothetical protein|nr:MAG: hypothetical protein KatS3mg108_1710 [Isosphaeraceae bacterium]
MSGRRAVRATLGPALATLSLWSSSPAQEPDLPPLPGGQPLGIELLDPEGLAGPMPIGATTPDPTAGMVPAPATGFGCSRCGKIHRLGHRIGSCLQEHVIGYPEYFQEPALGRALYNIMGRQVAKGEVHTFTLYRSDFVAGTAQLSPHGARRLSYLASRLERWAGPVVIEWTPEEPLLGQARREAVAGLLRESARGIDPERVVVGPAAFRGLTGPEAGNNHDALTFRNYTAPRSFSVTPTSTAEFGGGSR